MGLCMSSHLEVSRDRSEKVAAMAKAALQVRLLRCSPGVGQCPILLHLSVKNRNLSVPW